MHEADTVNGNGDSDTTVLVVGAGPAGLMLGCNLVRYGIKTMVIDDRPESTQAGRADGLQPKSIETFKQLGLADPLIRKGVKVFDIAYWQSTTESPSLKTTGRQIHYPEIVDALDPYVLLVHQGMVEDVLITDMAERGVTVIRSCAFDRCTQNDDDSITVTGKNPVTGEERTFTTQYLVGCDGSRSRVRDFIPGSQLEGDRTNATWAVLDGVIDTDFPDLWTKFFARSETVGTVLGIPRERNMTRLYIELTDKDAERLPKAQATAEYVMNKAREVMAPYKMEWESVDWFSNYMVGQRVASIFTDSTSRVFIAGDAAHTHSPKAAQGMNTSMHDTFNLAWKLNLVIRGISSPSLLSSYTSERRQIAEDLIAFDAGHMAAVAKGEAALTQNFLENIRFIAGVGAEYRGSEIDRLGSGCASVANAQSGMLKPGALLTPAMATRYTDANPINLQLDIPLLSQLRLYFLIPSITDQTTSWLNALFTNLTAAESIISRATNAAETSHTTNPAPKAPANDYIQPQRYQPTSKVMTYALITKTPRPSFSFTSLPTALQKSKWTLYFDDVLSGNGAIGKWMGIGFGEKEGEIGVVGVRPDGYVGFWGKYDCVGEANAKEEIEAWVGGIFEGK